MIQKGHRSRWRRRPSRRDFLWRRWRGGDATPTPPDARDPRPPSLIFAPTYLAFCAFSSCDTTVLGVARGNGSTARLPADLCADQASQHGADAGRLERRLHPATWSDGSASSPKSGVPGNDTFGKSTFSGSTDWTSGGRAAFASLIGFSTAPTALASSSRPVPRHWLWPGPRCRRPPPSRPVPNPWRPGRVARVEDRVLEGVEIKGQGVRAREVKRQQVRAELV